VIGLRSRTQCQARLRAPLSNTERRNWYSPSLNSQEISHLAALAPTRCRELLWTTLWPSVILRSPDCFGLEPVFAQDRPPEPPEMPGVTTCPHRLDYDRWCPFRASVLKGASPLETTGAELLECRVHEKLFSPERCRAIGEGRNSRTNVRTHRRAIEQTSRHRSDLL